MKLISRILLAAGVATALAAGGCDDGNGGGVVGGGGGGGVAGPEAGFGAIFAGAFNADANAAPIDPQPGDLPPVSLTAEPVNF